MDKRTFDSIVEANYLSWKGACSILYGERTEERLHDGLCSIYERKGYLKMDAKKNLVKIVRKWVYFAASNKVRALRKDNEKNVDIALHADQIEAPDNETELKIDVRKAVGKLNYRQQQIVLAIYWDGATIREVAARLGCSVFPVMSDLHIAHEILRGELREYGKKRPTHYTTTEFVLRGSDFEHNKMASRDIILSMEG